MHYIDFPEANITLSKPADMTDEECSPLRAMQGVDSQGFPFFMTAWQLNKDDVAAILAGRPIYLKSIGTGFQPVALFTLDENGEGNF